MADHEMRRKANIGSSSLILIFIVLCLATFSILSLSNAKREAVLSEKNAAAVQAYYRADSEGVAFLAEVSRSLSQIPEGMGEAAAQQQILEQMNDHFEQDSGHLYTEIPMDNGQALRIELEPDWIRRTCQIDVWNVYQKEEMMIDQSITVWTGGELIQ